MEPIATHREIAQLYEAEETAWLFCNSRLLREGKLDEADIAHIAEFLEDMGKRDKREVMSRLIVLLRHLLKWEYQPHKRTGRWKATIREQRFQLQFDLETSAMLTSYAREKYRTAYEQARKQAADETGLSFESFPAEPPVTFNQATDQEFFPNNKPRVITARYPEASRGESPSRLSSSPPSAQKGAVCAPRGQILRRPACSS